MIQEAPPQEYLDGCTAFPDEIGGNDLIPCCDAHDISYWYAETSEEKFSADLELFMCVAQTGGEWYMWVIAFIMFAAVATFGWFFWWNRDKKWKKDETEPTNIGNSEEDRHGQGDP